MQLNKSLLRTTDAYIKKLDAAGIRTVSDFLSIFPKGYEDKSEVCTIFSHINIQEKQTVKAKIELLTHEMTRNKKLLIKAVLVDEVGSHVDAVWFNQRFILQKFAVGDTVLIFGKPKYEYGRLSFASCEIEHYREKRQEIVPIYSDINYISGKWIRDKMVLLREYIAIFSDIIPEEIRQKKGFAHRHELIDSIHFPSSKSWFEQAQYTLWYEELFQFQLKGITKKYELLESSKWYSPAIPIDTDLIKKLLSQLEFTLTDKQKIVLFQILKDMEQSHTMARLLQWDVGTGKTIVAMIAAIHAIQQSSVQVAIMAPTEILARQHFVGNETWLMELWIRADILVGSMTPRQKSDVRDRLKKWQIDIVFGTHALIQDSVQFANLWLVVLDEQHRFGVDQRKTLEEYCSTSNIRPHRLNMSATPIPRTLALTIYGDQDISVLDEYPIGRKMIYTRVIHENSRPEVYATIQEEINQWWQVYWISPLVEESETLDIASATNMQELLVWVFPKCTVGLIHGKMRWWDKDAIMRDFYEWNINILSSTSVVEVGVDNPNATIICIEASERFWLSQLHQFRGRVGRGDKQSYCYLFTTKEYKNDRLKAMEKTNDGFELAEIDLELRWPWEVYGVRQSWIPDFYFADLRDVNLISEIRTDIENWLQTKKDL